jgi:zinc transport system permease protein
MMELWHKWISALPFDWAEFGFMRNALLAVLVASPVFATMGTLVVNNRMAFFSEAIGHASLTGVGLGVLLGLADPQWALTGFALVLGAGILLARKLSGTAMDTIISLSMSFTIALGVVLLSRGGGFSKYTHYLVGDLLSITAEEVGRLTIACLCIAVWLCRGYNRVLFTGLNESLARSRGWSVMLTQIVFASAIVVLVTMNLRWVGILIVNSMLILPAAAARNVAVNTRQYVAISIVVAVVSGVAGLMISYYAGTATSAMVVLCMMACFGFTMIMRLFGLGPRGPASQGIGGCC